MRAAASPTRAVARPMMTAGSKKHVIHSAPDGRIRPTLTVTHASDSTDSGGICRTKKALPPVVPVWRYVRELRYETRRRRRALADLGRLAEERPDRPNRLLVADSVGASAHFGVPPLHARVVGSKGPRARSMRSVRSVSRPSVSRVGLGDCLFAALPGRGEQKGRAGAAAAFPTEAPRCESATLRCVWQDVSARTRRCQLLLVRLPATELPEAKGVGGSGLGGREVGRYPGPQSLWG